jgi:hypothetical protein
MPIALKFGARILRQWPVLAIQALTTAAGVANPVAMFSPAADQAKPAAEIRAAKFVPWVNLRCATIDCVQPWADRSRRLSCASDGRPCAARWRLTRHSTAVRMAAALAVVAAVVA